MGLFGFIGVLYNKILILLLFASRLFAVVGYSFLSIGRNCGAVLTHGCNEGEELEPAPVFFIEAPLLKEAEDIFHPVITTGRLD